MKSWIRYIFLSAAAWGALLTSCNNVLDEEGITACDDKTATVHLTISFGGDEGPMSRDVDSPTQNGALDYTTEGQAAIVDGDIYALVVDEKDNFLYRITDLKVIEGPADNDNYYTRTLEGTMRQTTDEVKIVLLANLTGQGIDGLSTAGTFIDGYKEKSITDLYDALKYNYDGTKTPWDIEDRKIPMWGESTAQAVTQNFELDCYLYRAVAKVQIWVNNQKGIDGFTINSITVNNIHTKGYCVSQADFNQNGPNYNFNNDNTLDAYPYAAPYPYVPRDGETYTYQDVTYTPTTDEEKTEAYSDNIYLPEQINIGAETPATITVNYTYNNSEYTGTINFQVNGTGDRFDIIRNHSYIFNINLLTEDAKLYYTVTEMPEVNIEIPPFE